MKFSLSYCLQTERLFGLRFLQLMSLGFLPDCSWMQFNIISRTACYLQVPGSSPTMLVESQPPSISITYTPK